jgi:hypothetical protein
MKVDPKTGEMIVSKEKRDKITAENKVADKEKKE